MSYFDITAKSYGGPIREVVQNKNLKGLSKINFGDHYKLPSKSLCYVESHDNYEHKQSSSTSDWNIKMGFAILDARANFTPQFFIEPYDNS
ncbi:hypothetical protein [Clostridium felsineum]|uniref:hypothetical protein n=1 Tax=Clostridium felsineum TaxID=36839 RepID=UPI0009CA9085|nr:hypothetical protein [Clostridium felsineum]URZ18492.1 Alpha-amylase [Clostridium felsineum DSM 794]